MNRSIHRILNTLTFSEIYHEYLQLPPDDLSFPDFVLGTRSKRKFVPYFNGCLGALDGTHVPVHASETSHAAYRDRKGNVSQNVLIACSLDMKIVYVLSGWEGSASDSRVFNHAWNTMDFKIPADHYYLGNSGYANSEAVMVPYRSMCYRLKEWGSTNNRSTDLIFLSLF